MTSLAPAVPQPTMPDDDAHAGDLLEIIPLGAGSEVGRSCVIARYKQKTLMFDCGIHPGYAGLASLPYFDEIDLADVDALFSSWDPDGSGTLTLKELEKVLRRPMEQAEGGRRRRHRADGEEQECAKVKEDA